MKQKKSRPTKHTGLGTIQILCLLFPAILKEGQASLVCDSCTVFRVFRNIPSSLLSRLFKAGSVFHFSAIYPIYSPKVYKKSSLNGK